LKDILGTFRNVAVLKLRNLLRFIEFRFGYEVICSDLSRVKNTFNGDLPLRCALYDFVGRHKISALKLLCAVEHNLTSKCTWHTTRVFLKTKSCQNTPI